MEMKIYLICFLVFVYLPNVWSQLAIAYQDECESYGTWEIGRFAFKEITPGECKTFCKNGVQAGKEKFPCIFWQLDHKKYCHIHYILKKDNALAVVGINYCKKGGVELKPSVNAPTCTEYMGTGRPVENKYKVNSKEDCKSNCQGCLVWEYTIANNECRLTHLEESPRWNHRVGSYGINYCSQGDTNQQPPKCRCGIPNYSASSRIIGGTHAPRQRYPWQVYIRAYEQNEGPYRNCGGTLISDSAILTAAHCLYKWIQGIGSTKLPKIRAWVNIHDITKDVWSNYEVKVQDFEAFDNTRVNEEDIAIIKIEALDFSNTKARPICLPEGNKKFSGVVFENKNTQLLGWGYKTPVLNGKLEPWLREVTVKTISSCYTYRDEELYMCSYTPGRVHWKGDSGGPYMIEDGLTKKYILTGVISQGLPHINTWLGVGTRTSAYLYWIKEKGAYEGEECK